MCWGSQPWTYSLAMSPAPLMAQQVRHIMPWCTPCTTAWCMQAAALRPQLSCQLADKPCCCWQQKLLPGVRPRSAGTRWSMSRCRQMQLACLWCFWFLAADAQSTPSVLVLAEHTFFILDLYGHILVQRRLDHHPSCFWPYPASTDASAAGARGSSSSSRSPGAVMQTDNLLVATHSKSLQVYRGQQLAWAAQLELVPVAVRVTSIGGVRGMIVALDDSGGRRPRLP